MSSVPRRECTSTLRRRTSHSCLLVFVASTAVLLSSCNIGVHTLWSTKVQSPDGKMVAIVRVIQHSGPGTASIENAVYLRATNASSHGQLIFDSASYGGPSKRGIVVKWLAPSKVQVEIGQKMYVAFLVAIYGGVHISVRDLSGEAINNSR